MEGGGGKEEGKREGEGRSGEKREEREGRKEGEGRPGPEIPTL